MAQPGWYPDPDRTPGRYRFWTGTAWTDQTTLEPPPTSPKPPTSRGPLVALVVVLAVLLVVIIAVVSFNRQRSAVREPSTVPTSSASGWNDSSPLPTATPTPSRSPRASGSPDPVGTTRPQACDQYQGSSSAVRSSDGRVHGGALSFAKLPDGWQGPDPTTRLPFSRNAVYQHRTLPEKLSWEASAYIGESTIPASVNGTEATNRMLQCVVTSDFYVSVNVQVADNSAKKITISGKPAVQRDALLRFNHPDLKTTGSLLRFIVVDSSPRSFFFYAVPMERHDLISQLAAATQSLRVG